MTLRELMDEYGIVRIFDVKYKPEDELDEEAEQAFRRMFERYTGEE